MLITEQHPVFAGSWGQTWLYLPLFCLPLPSRAETRPLPSFHPLWHMLFPRSPMTFEPQTPPSLPNALDFMGKGAPCPPGSCLWLISPHSDLQASEALALLFHSFLTGLIQPPSFKSTHMLIPRSLDLAWNSTLRTKGCPILSNLTRWRPESLTSPPTTCSSSSPQTQFMVTLTFQLL